VVEEEQQGLRREAHRRERRGGHDSGPGPHGRGEASEHHGGGPRRDREVQHRGDNRQRLQGAGGEDGLHGRGRFRDLRAGLPAGRAREGAQDLGRPAGRRRGAMRPRRQGQPPPGGGALALRERHRRDDQPHRGGAPVDREAQEAGLLRRAARNTADTERGREETAGGPHDDGQGYPQARLRGTQRRRGGHRGGHQRRPQPHAGGGHRAGVPAQRVPGAGHRGLREYTGQTG